MLTKEENELLTRVGPERRRVQMLRHYWWPVAFSDQVQVERRADQGYVTR